MSKIFVVSDTWFNRPIDSDKTTYEYNNSIINDWNSIVDNEDIVYVLGGLGIGDLYNLVLQLNGTIHILDNYLIKEEKEFIDNLKDSLIKSIDESIKDKFIFESKQIIILPELDCILSYFPLSEWYGKENGTYQFHGLTNKSELVFHKISCNIKSWDNKPVDIDKIKSNITKFENV